MKKQDALFAGAMLVVLALIAFALCGCTVAEWRPQAGDSYASVRKALDPGTKIIEITGDEARWYFERGGAYVYYAKFDAPLLSWRIVKPDSVTDVPSEARLLEFVWNTRAYPDTTGAQP